MPTSRNLTSRFPRPGSLSLRLIVPFGPYRSTFPGPSYAPVPRTMSDWRSSHGPPGSGRVSPATASGSSRSAGRGRLDWLSQRHTAILCAASLRLACALPLWQTSASIPPLAWLGLRSLPTSAELCSPTARSAQRRRIASPSALTWPHTSFTGLTQSRATHTREPRRARPDWPGTAGRGR